MDTKWQETFRARMRRFEVRRPKSGADVAVSIKVRVSSGCFHREHSPKAYEIIDDALASSPTTGAFSFEEHESGPELLVYVATTTAAVSLAAGIVNLVTAIIKRRLFFASQVRMKLKRSRSQTFSAKRFGSS